MSMKGCVEMKLKKYILTTIIFALLVPLIAACSESTPAMSAEERAEERQRILSSTEPSPIFGNPVHFRSIDEMVGNIYRVTGGGRFSPQVIRVEVIGEGVREYHEMPRGPSIPSIVTEVRVLEVFLGSLRVGEVLSLQQGPSRRAPLLIGDDVVLFSALGSSALALANSEQAAFFVPPEVNLTQQMLVDGMAHGNISSTTVLESVHPANTLTLTVEHLEKIVRGELPTPWREPPPPLEPTIRLNPAEWWTGAAAASTTVEIDTDLGWWDTYVFVFSEYDWLFVERLDDTPDVLVIRVDENLYKDMRIGMVDIISGGETRSIVVTQTDEEQPEG